MMDLDHIHPNSLSLSSSLFMSSLPILRFLPHFPFPFSILLSPVRITHMHLGIV